MNKKNHSSFLFLLLLILNFKSHGDSILPKPTTKDRVAGEIYLNRSALLDSLFTMQIKFSKMEDSLKTLMRQQKEEIKNLKEEANQLRAANTRINQDLGESKGDNLQSAHTNSVLFIMNLCVGLILLLTLLWMFFKRKDQSRGNIKNYTSGISTESLEYRLDRIEKLGHLKEKGLLTDEEFTLQKKQILGDRNL